MTTIKRPELLAFALAALAIVAYVALAVAGQPTPGWLEVIAVGGLASGSGLSVPTAPTGAALDAQVAQLQALLDQHAQAHQEPTS